MKKVCLEVEALVDRIVEWTKPVESSIDDCHLSKCLTYRIAIVRRLVVM